MRGCKVVVSLEPSHAAMSTAVTITARRGSSFLGGAILQLPRGIRATQKVAKNRSKSRQKPSEKLQKMVHFFGTALKECVFCRQETGSLAILQHCTAHGGDPKVVQPVAKSCSAGRQKVFSRSPKVHTLLDSAQTGQPGRRTVICTPRCQKGMTRPQAVVLQV